MLARCATYVLDGIEARRVTIECDVRPGLPAFSIVGLGDAAVRELRETVRSAIVNSDYEFPQQRITLNIAPASLRRNAPSTTLAAALAVLAATGQISAEIVASVAVYGDLGIGGAVRPLAGTLAAAIAHSSSGGSTPFLHAGGALPYDLAPTTSRPITCLADVVDVSRSHHHDVCAVPASPSAQPDFADLRVSDETIFALTVAAAGGHHVLLLGAPGSGKTSLARRLPSILPDLTDSESREVATIRDAVGLGHDRQRPFRAPHHTISAAGLVGGGAPVRPGEITLAHRGVVLLDDLPEFSRSTLDALRAPLTDQYVTLIRGDHGYHFPAAFQLVAAASPCPCGRAGTDRCICDADALIRYRRRLTAPLLDRISIVINLNNGANIASESPAATSAGLRARVSAARETHTFRQTAARQSDTPLDETVRRTLSASGQTALDDAYRAGSLSTRGQGQVLNVARTVADLAGESLISADTIRTALGLRGDLQINTTLA